LSAKRADIGIDDCHDKSFSLSLVVGGPTGVSSLGIKKRRAGPWL
jgi:hypothetical protein